MASYISRRHDFQLKNTRNMNIKCTLFEPIKKSMVQQCEDEQKPFPCVIYCHCNTGGRLEAFQYLKPLLSRGIGLFALDFAGSGLSEGEFITLGKYEVDDLRVSVEYLRNCGKVSQIGLWGRSMGAAIALLYAANDPIIDCLVADSPFGNLKDLTLELA